MAYFLNLTNSGMTNTKAGIENNNPPTPPVAKENQKGSSSPSIKKGIMPITVETTVKKTGIIGVPA